MTHASVDVIILGAGAAGLAAAMELSRNGRTVAVLEARGRIGGRIHTVHDPTWPVPVELGAEFIHGRPASTWEILRALRAPAYDVADTHWYFQRGRVRKADFWDDIQRVLGKLENVGRQDMSFAEFLKRHARREPESIRAMATGFVEGFNATDRNKVSARFLKAAQSAGDAIDEMKAYRLHAGYDRVPGYLLAGLDPSGATVHLSTPAQAVRWSKGSVQVTARGPAGDERRYRGKAAVIALPLGVLQADPGEEGGVAFDPPVPQVRRARDRMAMGPVIKVVARFAEPFWEGRADLRDLCFLHAPGEAFPTFWTSLPVRATVLTGWAGGPAAERLAGQSPPGVLDAFLTTVAKSLGTPKRRVASLLQSWHVADWQSDPWSRGAYSYALVGGAAAPAAMARPVAGTLFFAGEHTHPGETGTVAAAIESGQRAARQAIIRV